MIPQEELDFEITPDMIETGRSAYLSFGEDAQTTLSSVIVQEIFEAMCEAGGLSHRLAL